MEIAPAASFAALLRRFRLATGLSQEALAERAGLSARAISDLERGVRQAPYRETVHLLAGALGLTGADRAALEGTVHRTRSPRAPVSGSDQHSLAGLPAAVTRLIGRDEAIAAVRQYLGRGDVRLLTFTGPPGIGKTRLALATASTFTDEWPDGIVFVNLAPLADPRLVATSILQALGLTDVGARPAAERLRDVLRDKRLLMVLDNFEQVLDAGLLVGTLLENCPRLAMLVTSRTALRLRGEQEYPVPPLPVPPPPDGSDGPLAIENLSALPAVALFVERARAVSPVFTLTEENASAVAKICRHLDGLPLAIELAAARSKVLTPQAMLDRLGHRLDLLTTGARDGPARHRTLREAIAWSHGLLSAEEQVLFRRLGVFVGGCTMTAAERVCDANGDLGLDVFDGVTALVDQSLLQQDVGVDAELRFTMLETLREYALEQLTAAGEYERCRAWHAADVLALAEEAEPHLFTGARGVWLQRLSEEQENIRSALSWALGQEDPELGLRLVGALWLWLQRRLLIEGRQWAEELLAHPGAHRSEKARASALFAAGHFAWLQGDVPVMRTHMDEAVRIRRRTGDAAGLGRALPFLGLAIADDVVMARRLAEEGVARCREAGDQWGVALALTNLGRIAATSGDDAVARPPLEEATALFRDIGDDWLLALPLTSLGAIAYRAGSYEEAQAAFEEALPRFRAVEDRRNTTQVLTNLGYVALARDDVEGARGIFGESLLFGREHGDRFNAPACLRGFSAIALAYGDPTRAVRLIAAAEMMFAATGATRWPAERLGGPGSTDALHAALGEDRFTAAWEFGQGLSLEQLVADMSAQRS